MWTTPLFIWNLLPRIWLVFEEYEFCKVARNLLSSFVIAEDQ